MATFKHISSKNADYGAAEQYLTFEHDEFTMKPTLDEAGRLILREDYRIATLNCGEEDFAVACMRSNLRYGKNQKREDVKSHHYIISFDPRDATDNGLTVDRAQRLGEKFCAEHFPGHQAVHEGAAVRQMEKRGKLAAPAVDLRQPPFGSPTHKNLNGGKYNDYYQSERLLPLVLNQ